MSQYYISFTFNQQVFNYSLVANNSKESHYCLRLCFMQVLRDHELVLSCTRNLVLVFSIVILFTTQDVSGESILSQSCQFSEKKKLDDKIKSFLHGEVFPKKRQFPQFVSQFIVTDFTYILQDTNLQKWNISLFLISFCLFIGSCYVCQCIRLHLRPISHIFLSFILIHLSHFIKFYLLFTNLKFKKKEFLVFLFRRSTLLQFRIIVNSF